LTNTGLHPGAELSAAGDAGGMGVVPSRIRLVKLLFRILHRARSMFEVTPVRDG